MVIVKNYGLNYDSFFYNDILQVFLLGISRHTSSCFTASF